VLSRLQRWDLRKIGPAAIRARLREVLTREGIQGDDDALTLIARHADGGMRDALSMLDQCLSFGDGAVTAVRVREILGLAGDERYAEVLALVAERRPAAVFPLVERLMDAGADLAEFMGGVGEMLRALLMVQLGAEPEDLTEVMRETLSHYRDQFTAGDVLRMLKLLADNETAVRRSGNPRLVVEMTLPLGRSRPDRGFAQVIRKSDRWVWRRRRAHASIGASRAASQQPAPRADASAGHRNAAAGNAGAGPAGRRVLRGCAPVHLAPWPPLCAAAPIPGRRQSPPPSLRSRAARLTVRIAQSGGLFVRPCGSGPPVEEVLSRGRGAAAAAQRTSGPPAGQRAAPAAADGGRFDPGGSLEPDPGQGPDAGYGRGRVRFGDCGVAASH
jgi:DNA polymerase-3 subunit gamma/tau